MNLVCSMESPVFRTRTLIQGLVKRSGLRRECACFVIVYLAMACGAVAQETDSRRLPPVFARDGEGRTCVIPKEKLFVFERDSQARVMAKDGPSAVFILATSASGDFYIEPRGKPKYIRRLCIIHVFRERGELLRITGYGEKHKRRELSAEELQTINEFVTSNAIDNLPALTSTRVVDGKTQQIVGGTTHVYVHMTRESGRRVFMNNPASIESGEKISVKYGQLVRFFERIFRY